MVKVKVLEVDRQGRVRLSIKEANAPTEVVAPVAAAPVAEVAVAVAVVEAPAAE
jgi:polyribonucleotide nucleotidyltransferase